MSLKSERGPKDSPFKQAAGWLAKTMAIAVAFFATGPSYTATIPSIRSFVETAYAPELVWVASVGWFAVVAVSVFAFATLSIFLFVQIVGAWFSKTPFSSK